MRKRDLVTCAVALGVTLVGGSCGDEPGTTTAPPPAASVSSSDQQQAAVFSSFYANPATITEGDSFTLSWDAVGGGTVSLAVVGQSPFAVGLASRGSQVLDPSSPGYPSGPGEIQYEARLGDAAVRSETTVTVHAMPTPTPTPEPTPRPTPAPFNWSGTWEGTAALSLVDGSAEMVIQQAGEDVSGTFTVDLLGQTRGGDADGSVSDTVLELDVEDSGSPCTAHAHGTRAGRTVSGTLKVADDCAVGGLSGTFSLTKQ